MPSGTEAGVAFRVSVRARGLSRAEEDDGVILEVY